MERKKQNALSSNLMQIFRKSIECKLSFINKIKADLLFQSYVWIRTNLLKHFSLTQGHDKVSQTIMPPKTIETWDEYHWETSQPTITYSKLTTETFRTWCEICSKLTIGSNLFSDKSNFKWYLVSELHQAKVLMVFVHQFLSANVLMVFLHKLLSANVLMLFVHQLLSANVLMLFVHQLLSANVLMVFMHQLLSAIVLMVFVHQLLSANVLMVFVH